MRRACFSAVCIAWLILPARASQPQASADDLMARASSWLTQYELELSTIVADEELTQRFRPASRGLQEYRTTLRSIFSFMRLPGGGAWLGLREVQWVNRARQQPDGPGLMALLSNPEGDRVALANELAQRNARYNFGLPRTTNVPTLPLELMHPRHRPRFEFTLDGFERMAGVQTARVSFAEHTRPTLIRSPDGFLDIQTRGTLWIEPQTGRFRRALIEAWQADIAKHEPEWTLTVSFAANAEVGVLVPTTLQETFFMPGGRGESDGRYTKFRRFTTAARILPVPPQ
jgi:hypothetical protein